MPSAIIIMTFVENPLHLIQWRMYNDKKKC